MRRSIEREREREREREKLCNSLLPLPTGSEEGSGSVVHGQSVDELPGRGAQRAPLEQGEGERSVV